MKIEIKENTESTVKVIESEEELFNILYEEYLDDVTMEFNTFIGDVWIGLQMYDGAYTLLETYPEDYIDQRKAWLEVEVGEAFYGFETGDVDKIIMGTLKILGPKLVR